MALTPTDIRDCTLFAEIIRQQSTRLIQVNVDSSRMASIFASQHRWLMAHIGLALHFRSVNNPKLEGLNPASFIREVQRFDVMSRNTAAAFLAEMLKYGIIVQAPHPTDRRKRMMVPSSATIDAINRWLLIHFITLDSIDGGMRESRYLADKAQLSRLHPLIAENLLQAASIRAPSPEFSHFMWINNGFLITERLISSMHAAPEPDGRILTSFTNIAGVIEGLNLSRSHATRKINEAEGLQILGWSGTKGRSQIWVSGRFLNSFLEVQAAKLAIIDAAFDACFP